MVGIQYNPKTHLLCLNHTFYLHKCHNFNEEIIHQTQPASLFYLSHSELPT